MSQRNRNRIRDRNHNPTRTLPRRLSSVHDVRRALERDQYPRLQMLIIVVLTGAAGFAASALMLHLGVTVMALRYLLALCVAYLMFFFIVWVWLRWRADGLDGIDLGGGELPSPSSPSFSGKGGTFDGGGASGDYQPAPQASDLADSASKALDGVDVDVGDAAIPLFVAGLIAGVVFCALFVVYSAPLLFAELLVDGVLSASLYRRLRGIDRHHWLQTALRRTVWPFIFAAVSVTAIGACLSFYTPGAHSIGEAIRQHASVASE